MFNVGTLLASASTAFTDDAVGKSGGAWGSNGVSTLLRKNILSLMSASSKLPPIELQSILITSINGIAVKPGDKPNVGTRRLGTGSYVSRELATTTLTVSMRIASSVIQSYQDTVTAVLKSASYTTKMKEVSDELNDILGSGSNTSPAAAGAATCPLCPAPPTNVSGSGVSAGAAAGIAVGVIALAGGVSAAGYAMRKSKGGAAGKGGKPVMSRPPETGVSNPAFGAHAGQHSRPPGSPHSPAPPQFAGPPGPHQDPTTPTANPYFQGNGVLMASPVGASPRQDGFAPLMGEQRPSSFNAQLAAAAASGSNPSSPRPPSSSAQAAATAQRNEQLKAFASSLASREGASAAFKRGADALFAAQEGAQGASRKALMARIMRKWSGRKASEMTPLEAALVCQRGWLNYRARKLVKMWVKIVAFDGDVFYKNKLTGTLEWEIPPLPPMTQAEKQAAVSKIKPGIGASVRQRPAAILAGPSARSNAAPAPAEPTAPAALFRKVGRYGVALPVQVDPETGDQYVYNGKDFFFLDGPDGKLLQAGWRRMEDEEDVWYSNAEGETVWEPAYLDE